TGVYLMYSYARSCSILDKASYDTTVQPPAQGYDDLEKQEYMLMRQLAYWPEMLDTAIQELAPNQICCYIHELATRFNHFYATCPIMKAEESKRKLRLWLTSQFHLTMKEALDILGLPAPKRM
ncbi:DALR anticodon-binding domain-containing protein, partial [Neobacillus drentensis]|uniref:DALR anticodon-binding domain-containing protein n=1 Tax=Neobacillus drentensis TaxID=220684 RepID=UPI0030032C5B